MARGAQIPWKDFQRYMRTGKLPVEVAAVLKYAVNEMLLLPGRMPDPVTAKWHNGAELVLRPR